MGQDIDCLVVEVGEAGKRWFQLIKFDFQDLKKLFQTKNPTVENVRSYLLHQIEFPPTEVANPNDQGQTTRINPIPSKGIRWGGKLVY